MEPASIRETWNTMRTSARPPRARDAAAQMGISEGELVAALVGTENVRLDVSCLDIMKGAGTFGHVMALTRNEACVHERKGIYKNISGSPEHVLVVGADIDLRMFPRHWAYSFACETESPRGTLRSVQTFDASGTAVHKIYLTETSDLDAYRKFVEQYRSAAQDDSLAVRPAPAPPVSSANVDVGQFRADWRALRDTHDFFPLLRKHGVTRIAAMHAAGDDLARSIPRETITTMLNAVSERNAEIMCFVGNDGAIQIHSGPASNIMATGPWINVMDPLWNLHLNLDRVHTVWAVEKPSDDGPIHSIEAFAENGDFIVQFFGKRKPGVPEREDWAALWQELRQAGEVVNG